MNPEEIRRPSLTQLRAHMAAYGPDGILESAQHLSEDERAQLEADCKAAAKAVRHPKRRRRVGRKGKR